MQTQVGNLLITPEIFSAWTALQELHYALIVEASAPFPTPLFLHGPSGVGKTLLVQSLVDSLTPSPCNVSLRSSNDFAEVEAGPLDVKGELLILEDLQHLPLHRAEMLIQVLDERSRRRLPTVCTAIYGPAHLQHRDAGFPHRLTTRLASGLVIALEPLQKPSRRRLLAMLAEAQGLNLATEIFDWLAEHLTGGRQLEGAVRQLTMLQRLRKKPLQLDDIREHYRAQLGANTPTVQRIAERVSSYYRVTPKRLLSARRSRDVLMPRQVSMYLARRLTPLSLEQIGRSLGGRDHKTVQHACKKIELAMKTDHALCGALRQMHAELA
jgi:chromosomal replication initiator protein